MKLYIGTSGYSYKEWKGNFYPEKIKNEEMLKFYSAQFNSVEINNTFYRVPKKEVIQNWAKQVPKDFKFSVKASRNITHIKKLKDAESDLKYFIENVKELKSKLGILLIQLPPSFSKNLERLRLFTESLPEKINAAFEFRHPTWFDEEVYELLKEKKFSMCLSQTDEEPDVKLINTASYAYLRLRKTDYSKKEINEWWKKIQEGGWDEVFVFFKHEDGGLGPKFARQLIEISEL